MLPIVAVSRRSSPPQVQVTTTYTGADAQTVAETVTTPIEQQINGVKGMIYIQLGQHEQRRLDDRRDLRRRLFPGHRRRRHPEPGRDGPGRACRPRSSSSASTIKKTIDRHGLRGQPGLARRPVRLDLPRQLRADLRRRRPQADSRGQRRQRLRPQVRHADLARPGPHGQPADLAGRGDRGDPVREPPGRRRQDRRPAGPRRASGSSTRSLAKGRLSTVQEFEEIIVRRHDDGSSRPAQRRRPGRARLGELRARPAGSTASPPARSRSTSTPTPMPSTSSSRSARDGPAGQRASRRASSTGSPTTRPSMSRENIDEVEHTLLEAFVLVLDRRLRVPAGRARDDHPHAGDPGLAGRHVRD